MESAIANISKRPGRFKPWTLSPEDLAGNVFILGMSRAAQDTMLRLIEARMKAGDPLAVIDPDGTLADRSLVTVPQKRTNDLVFFDPANQRTAPLGINPLDGEHSVYSTVAGDITQAIEAVFIDAWGKSSAWILRNSILALLHYPDATLADISKLLTNDSFRARVLKHVHPDFLVYWDGEFASYSKGQRYDRISPILNKVGSFWMNPIQRRVLQGKKTVDPRSILEHDRLFIGKLPLHQLRRDTTKLLGSLLLSMFISAVYDYNKPPDTEAEQPSEPKESKPFYLFVEDPSQFAAPTLHTALTDGVLSLVTRCESLDLLSDVKTKQDVLGQALLRADTIISFRLSVDDAEILSSVFNRQYLPDEFTYLEDNEMRIKTKRAGRIEVFRGVALPPTQQTHHRRNTLLQHSLSQYGRRKKNQEGGRRA